MLTAWLIDDVQHGDEPRASARERVLDFLDEPVDERERAEYLHARAERGVARRAAQVRREADMIPDDPDVPVIETDGAGPIFDPMLVQD